MSQADYSERVERIADTANLELLEDTLKLYPEDEDNLRDIFPDLFEALEEMED